MGVYIPNMEMPRHCGECGIEWCNRWKNLIIAGMSIAKSRPSDCPLVPVPPHYDLIDHNALKIAVMDCDAETRIDFLKHAMDCINKAPVVIPSDMPTYEAEEGE